MDLFVEVVVGVVNGWINAASVAIGNGASTCVINGINSTTVRRDDKDPDG